MFPLLDNPVLIDSAQRPEGISYEHLLKPHDLFGNYQFLHGVNVEEYQNKLYAFWARNEGKENSITEFTEYRVLEDGKWTPELHMPPIKMPSTPLYAHTHGVPFLHEGVFYYFRPRFQGLGDVPYTRYGARMIRFLNWCTEIMIFKPETGEWQKLPNPIIDFAPCGRPKQMADKRWIMAGIDAVFHAAVAISNDEFLTNWHIHYLRNNDQAYAECDTFVQGDTIMVLMRNEATGIVPTPIEAPLAISHDCGASFTYDWSNVPMSSSKPGCGVLSDGRPYILFSYEKGRARGRRRIYLAVGQKGAITMDKVYLLDDGELVRYLAYPYGHQVGEYLYVGYSSTSLGVPNWGGNPNDAMLARIPVSSL